jgi:hypothetical protein
VTVDPDDPIHVHVSFQLTAQGSQDVVDAMVDELTAQAADPSSLLLSVRVRVRCTPLLDSRIRKCKRELCICKGTLLFRGFAPSQRASC